MEKWTHRQEDRLTERDRDREEREREFLRSIRPKLYFMSGILFMTNNQHSRSIHRIRGTSQADVTKRSEHYANAPEIVTIISYRISLPYRLIGLSSLFISQLPGTVAVPPDFPQTGTADAEMKSPLL